MDDPESSQAEAQAPVGFWVRAGAYYVDAFLCVMAASLIMAAMGVLSKPASKQFLIGNAGIILAAIAYETAMIGMKGRTLGKMLAGTMVVAINGGRIGYGDALARCLARYACVFSLGIGYAMAAFTKNKRGLHDYICGTRVVYTGEISTARKTLVILLPLALLLLSGLLKTIGS